MLRDTCPICYAEVTEGFMEIHTKWHEHLTRCFDIAVSGATKPGDGGANFGVRFWHGLRRWTGFGGSQRA